MTPVGSATPAAAAEAVVPAELLHDGEVVILAIKPSRWLALLPTLPLALGAAAVAAVICAADRAAGVPTAAAVTYLLCIAAVGGRLLAGCLQWRSRLYVLTNRRALCVAGTAFGATRPFPRGPGLPHANVTACLLRDVRAVTRSARTLDRALGLTDLRFETADTPAGDVHWTYVPDSPEIREAVEKAVRQSR